MTLMQVLLSLVALHAQIRETAISVHRLFALVQTMTVDFM